VRLKPTCKAFGRLHDEILKIPEVNKGVHFTKERKDYKKLKRRVKRDCQSDALEAEVFPSKVVVINQTFV
jgi:hypothetical protein